MRVCFLFPQEEGNVQEKSIFGFKKKPCIVNRAWTFLSLLSSQVSAYCYSTCWLWIPGQLDLTDPRFLPTAEDLVSSIMQPCVRQGSLIFSGLPRPKQQSCKTTGLFLCFGSRLERRSHAAALWSLVMTLWTFNLGKKLLGFHATFLACISTSPWEVMQTIWFYDPAADVWR